MSEKEREPITKLTLTQINRILARCRETGVILYSVKYDPTMGITVNTYKDKTKEKNMRLNEIAKRGHEWAVKKGFWETHLGSFLYKIQRIISHAEAACGAYNNDEENEQWEGPTMSDKIDGVPRYAEKLADAVIEAVSFLHARGHDVEAIVKAKMDYNDTRTDKQ